MRLRLFLPVACLAAMLGACDNDNNPMLVPKGSPSFFRNDLNQTSYVNILYTPNQPGINFTKLSLLRQITVPAGATVPLGDSLLQTDKPYILDWHSADYTYSNFLLRLPQSYKPFNYYPLQSDSTVILNGKASPARLYCVGIDGKATHWKSVGAYNANGVSVWDTLKGRKHHSVYMDLMGLYIDTMRTDPAFPPTKGDVMQTNFYVSDSSRLLINANGWVLTNDLHPQAPRSTTSTDTLYMMHMIPDGKGKWMFEPPYIELVKTQTIPLK
ncbi:hypothetical protein [Polluticoccus soli]|uniref:hypothetical protein n=1 Tax=Polluticoccus soli TaxID=3034150 RepID=UPI0023E23DF8|nr:hypothetical protein [Flavipsychrobacter sp. JY13-12]